MIPFNVPPFLGTETDFLTQAINNHKICGDGPFTKECHAWLEKKTGAAKALLTTSCTDALEMAALLLDIKPGDEVILPGLHFDVMMFFVAFPQDQACLFGDDDDVIDIGLCHSYLSC